MGIGKNIKDILNEKGMTVVDLSERTGIPSTTLYSLIKRDSKDEKFETLKKIWVALDASLSQLVDGVDGAWEYYREDIVKDFGWTLKDDLIKHFDLLNDAGQLEAIRDVEKLTKIPEYKK